MATTSARVRCPHCSKSFKIPDRSLLGRTGKCSACGQKFTLVEDAGNPAASDSATAAAPAAPKPVAKPAPAPKPTTSADKPPARPAPPPPLVKKAPSSPAMKAAPPAPPPKPARVIDEEPPFGLNAKWVPDDAAVAVTAPAAVASDPDNPFAVAEATPPHAPRPTHRPADGAEAVAPPRRTGKRRTALLGGVAAMILIGGGVTVFLLLRAPSGEPVANGPGAISPPGTTRAPVAPAVYSREMLKGNLALLDEFRPTRGQPIPMQYVPNGVNLVVHLRPAELWSSDRDAAELRGSLTEGVTSWLDAKIKELCRREPSRISEVTFAFVLGAFGTQPASTQVVRLTEPDKMSSLIEEFRGKLLKEDLKPSVTLAPPNAFVVVDTSTFAISPSDTAEELEEALAVPNTYVSQNVAELLRQTDRERLLTVVGEMQDLRRHVDTLFVESARPTIHAIVDWLGEDVDAIAWSLHTRPALHSEIILRPKQGVSARALEVAIQQKLDALPKMVMNIVKGTRPAAKGFREIIGRYPAMLEAVVQSTVLRPDSRDVHAITVLPAKAAPNLALGTLLTWDELRRTPAGAASTVAAAAGGEKVADKLKKEILAEFNRMPLEQAVKYIGDETGVDFQVDGEALRLTGYTRNMPQTMSLGKVPATRALKEILSVPLQKDLAVFVDEAAGKAVMSTRPYLKQQGKTEFKLD